MGYEVDDSQAKRISHVGSAMYAVIEERGVLQGEDDRPCFPAKCDEWLEKKKNQVTRRAYIQT